MVEKRTDRLQIQNFARSGVEIFGRVQQNLQSLVERAAGVNYRGPNARAFKTACVNHALDYAESTSTTMRKMNDVIEQNTSFIAVNLGGERISLEPPAVVIQPPAIDTDESVEAADDTALTQLRQDIENIFSSISSLFEENMSNFNRLGDDGWWGPEYDNTQADLTRLTHAAVDSCNQSRIAMVGDVQTQIDILF